MSSVYVGQSMVHGRGLFASIRMDIGDWIGPWHVVEVKEEEVQGLYDYVVGAPDGTDVIIMGAVSFCNHSEYPNAELRFDRNGVHLRLLEDVWPGEELFIKYATVWWGEES